GFGIWVADLQAEATLDELPLEGKIALVVGNEAEGISAQMRELADKRYMLPMQGMVQSFNLSVALAISLQQIVPGKRAQLAGGDLSRDRQWQLRQRWLEYGVRHAKDVRQAYCDDPQP
ncbi:MAG TPA: TrmH family RNA methyltransferase, partial [Myxococcales bacterium]|nr:TrmH family RNA methyltransferase [Myxococcales bacterium]